MYSTLFMSYRYYKGRTTKVTFKLNQGHRQSWHRQPMYDFLFVFHYNHVAILHTFRDIISENLKTSRDRNKLTTPIQGTICISNET